MDNTEFGTYGWKMEEVGQMKQASNSWEFLDSVEISPKTHKLLWWFFVDIIR